MKKSVLITVLLLGVSISAIFARTNFTTSIGVKASYGNVRNINYGIHYDLKKIFLISTSMQKVTKKRIVCFLTHSSEQTHLLITTLVLNITLL